MVSCLSIPALAQQPQNPSPMVEHTRAHPRLKQESPPGRREGLEIGTLFLPARLKLKSPTLLLIFFHGGSWLPELAATQAGGTAVLTIQLRAGSGTYSKIFEDSGRFDRLMEEAESKAGVKFAPLTLGGWSAGCQTVRELLKTQRYYDLTAHPAHRWNSYELRRRKTRSAGISDRGRQSSDLCSLRARCDCRKEADDPHSFRDLPRHLREHNRDS